ncbi:MAG TPA: AarF/UbiB family protein [Ktedonobacteraceae bacterium]|nr:AarF/UbiB family protein [Ktedonobacteraceae bacterium]
MEWLLNQTKAMRHAIQDTRASLSMRDGVPNPLAFSTRLSDLTRSSGFLFLEAHFKTLEYYSRSAHVGQEGARELALGALAADLLSGYTLLYQRERWHYPVQPKDWNLMHRRGAERILDTSAAFGGTLIKACQFASTRPDILPTPYVGSLSKLQDRVPPHPWSEIASVIRQELGREPDEIFEWIERKPIAAASIAQVHRAQLADGREVAVKVQYQGIQSIIDTDLVVLQRIVKLVARLYPTIQLQPILDYLKETLPLELDFQREAKEMEELRAALLHRTDVVIPESIQELCTERVLVMEFINGVKITDRTAMLEAGISPSAVARLLNDVYAEQIFRLGLLHADPHPGNLFVQPGPKLVLLDHGLTVPLKSKLVEALGEMVRAILVADFDRLSKALTQAGMKFEKQVDITSLLQLVGVLLGEEEEQTSMDTLEVGQQLGKSIGQIPVELILMGRALGLMDGITKQLDPDVNAIEVIAEYVSEMATSQV